MTTPAGPEWWDTVTTLGYALRLGDLEAPTAAAWYAQTSGLAAKPQGDGVSYYHAVHVGFADPEAAQRFEAEANDHTLPGSHRRTAFTRNNVVTVVPTWLDPDKEPFTKNINDLPEAPGHATWRIDMGKHAKIASAARPKYVKAYQEFMAGMGLADATVEVVATAPGTWEGVVKGLDLDAVDLGRSVKALNSTTDVECEKNACWTTDNGIANAVWSISVATSHSGLRLGGLERKIGVVTQAKGARMWGVIDLASWEAMVLGDGLAAPAVRAVQFQIFPDSRIELIELR